MKSAPTELRKDNLFFSLVLCIVITLILTLIVILWSIGANGQGAEIEEPVDTQPLILSKNPNNDILRLWASPGSGTVVLYDHWNLYLFGSVNESYKVQINGAERFNGTLAQEFDNFTFDASSLSNVIVSIEIGNRSYTFSNIVVNHQGINYGGPGSSSGSNFKFSQADLDSSRLKTAFIVMVYSVISIFIAFWGVKLYRKKQVTTKA